MSSVIDKLILIIATSNRKRREEIADSIRVESVATLMKTFNKNNINEFIRTDNQKIFKTSAEPNWVVPRGAVLNRCNSFYIYIPSEKVFISMCAASPPVTVQYL